MPGRERPAFYRPFSHAISFCHQPTFLAALGAAPPQFLVVAACRLRRIPTCHPRHTSTNQALGHRSTDLFPHWLAAQVAARAPPVAGGWVVSATVPAVPKIPAARRQPVADR